MKKYFLLSIVLLINLSAACSSNKKQCEKTDYVQRELTERCLVNLNAVNKLYGYTRYFYPNQEAEKYSEVDWYKFLIYAIEQTIDSKSEIELRNNLSSVFKPMVPELVFEKSTTNSTYKAHKTPFYYWKHIGIGKHPANKDLYINKIEKVEIISYELPTPDSLYSFQLADNITAYMPLSVSSQFNKSNEWKKLEKERKKQKIKLADRSVFKYLISRKDAKLVTLYDDKIRYADMMVRWNVIKHFYPYFKEDELDNKWNERLNQAFVKVSQLTDYMDYPEIAKWLMSIVNDSHIETHENIYFGGLIARYIESYFTLLKVDWCDDNKIYIKSAPDSLANTINKGDEIISVNGMDIVQLIKIKSEFISASSPQGMMEKLVNRELLKSFTKDTIFNIKIKDAHDNVQLITIKPTERNWVMWDEEETSFIENLGDDIYYLNLCTFDKEHSYEVFKKIIPSLQKAKGVIVDVRGYPNAAIADDIVTHFSKDSVLSGDFLRPYYYFPNQENVILKNEGNGYLDEAIDSEFISTPLYVLINHKAMSYGETVINMFKNSTNGILVGSPTVGTNGDVTMINLPLCKFMMTAIYDPNNHGVGIIPDMLVNPTLQDIRKNKDVLLEAAMKYIKELDSASTK